MNETNMGMFFFVHNPPYLYATWLTNANPIVSSGGAFPSPSPFFSPGSNEKRFEFHLLCIVINGIFTSNDAKGTTVWYWELGDSYDFHIFPSKNAWIMTK